MSAPSQPNSDPSQETAPKAAWALPLGIDNTWAYLIPMAVYMAFGMFEPTPAVGDEPGEPGLFGLGYEHYPYIYTVKLLVTFAALAACAPAWRQWRLRVSPLAPLVGIVGFFAWIGVCKLHPEGVILDAIDPDGPIAGLLAVVGFGPRSAFNPFEHFGHTTICYAFITVRLIGLSIAVPIFEELMLRGWLMRNIDNPQFWTVKFGELTTRALVIGSLFPMLYHPEKVASLVWFPLVTLLMMRTKNYWDCVVAHGVTNLLLGFYVLKYEVWELW